MDDPNSKKIDAGEESPQPQSALSRLSRIETLWSVVRRAHGTPDQQAAQAQERLLERYEGAIRRYIQGAVRNQDLADELYQEFALRFVNGDFKSADPSRGRFRSFVKTILFRMVADHYRKRGRSREVALDPEQGSAVASSDPVPGAEQDELFLISWRDEVLAQTWESLADYEAGGGGAYHTVLKMRVEQPSLTYEELAAEISQQLGRNLKPGAARVQVHRARDKFASLLIELIENSLEQPSPEAVEEELADLRLIDYCREALAARND